MTQLVRLCRNAGAGDGGGGNGGGAGAGAGAGAGSGAGATFDWHSNLTPDVRNAPFISKFENTKEGMAKLAESYGNLEKLIGHEKIPIPKDDKDVEGWSRWSKAMGVPDKPEGYQLEDAKVPEALKGMMMDKNKFAAFMHSQRATPAQVKAAWNQYQMENINAYNNHMDTLQKNLDKTMNILRAEWGAQYDGNIEMSQQVINRFSEGDKEMNDFITSTIMKNPLGIKFMQRLGNQFAESNIDGFKPSRFALSPQQAQDELDKIMGTLDGPYFNQGNKHSKREHDTAVDRANELREIIAKAQRQA